MNKFKEGALGAAQRAIALLGAPKENFDPEEPEAESEPEPKAKATVNLTPWKVSSQKAKPMPATPVFHAGFEEVEVPGDDDQDGQGADGEPPEDAEPPRPVGDGPGIAIAADFMFPFDVVTQSIGIVAARGSGKTYLTQVMTEEFFLAGLPFVVIDPVGVYWGLRSSANGQSHGLEVYILGGEQGDVPLDPTSGKAIARWLLDYRKPTVLDLSLMRKAEQRVFVADLAEELYALSRLPLHIIVDEADLFIPQRASPEEKRVLAAFEDIVRRGRVRGLGITVVTQRPAVIHKDILTQIGTLIVLRMLGPQDRKSIEEWIKYHGDPQKQRVVLSSLASLPVGTAWVWSPGWLGVLKRVAIRTKITFDSSVTPKTDEPQPLPEVKSELDIDRLRVELADAINHDPHDPTVMKARIAELESALSDGGDSGRIGVSIIAKLQKRIQELEQRLIQNAPKIKSFDPVAFVVHVQKLGESIGRIEKSLAEQGIITTAGDSVPPEEESASASAKKKQQPTPGRRR
jgi:hypothetical protein